MATSVNLRQTEDHGPLVPVSTYGASKLAGEALIASYCAMFGLTAVAFRFGNVVGPRQTHGVGFDFARQLLADPSRLRVLGDGSQSKSYIHVSDVIEAVLLAASMTPTYAVYNVATGDYITVKEIAALAIEATGSGPDTELVFTGGDRGWKGDVPIVRLDTARIRSLGWSQRLSSTDAFRASLASIVTRCSRRKVGVTGPAAPTPRRAVFLDRDGVVNRAFVRDGRPYPPTSPADLEILPGVAEACDQLHDRGYLLVVVTNQPDIA